MSPNFMEFLKILLLFAVIFFGVYSITGCANTSIDDWRLTYKPEGRHLCDKIKWNAEDDKADDWQIQVRCYF